MFWIFFLVLTAVSYWVSSTFKRKFVKYSSVPATAGLTGAEVAQQMLADNNIYDVRITEASGYLTDHYNPATKVIALSRNVFYGHSVAAMAVAAHETGHALQHHRGYFWVHVRSGLVPLVQLGSHISSWLLLAGMLFLHTMPQLMLLGILAYGLVVLFSFVTLPVEFDASRRALEWLKEKGYISGEYYKMAKDALKWAAMTYVVAALTALASLIYYILIFLSATSSDE